MKKENNFFANLRISKKLAIAFSSITILLLIVAAYAFNSFRSISYQVDIFDKTANAKNILNLSRVEQIRFESDKNFETVDLVNEHIDKSLSLIREVETLMKSKVNKENAKLMLKSTNDFKTQFNSFVDNEKLKIDQGTIRANAANNVITAIRKTISLKEESLKRFSGASQINGYLMLKNALDSYMEVRIAANKYVAFESVEYANTLRDYLSLTNKYLNDAQSFLTEDDIILQLNNSIEALNIYKDAFEKYDSLVKLQIEQKKSMRISAQESADLSLTIEKGVVAFIHNLEKTSQIVNLIIISLSILFSIIISIIITKSITTPVSELVHSIDLIANYDLTHKIQGPLLSRKDEIGLLSRSVSKIENNLRNIMISISKNAQSVSASSEELYATSENLSEISTEVGKTISEIAEGANDQADDTQKGVWNINKLGNIIEKDQEYVQNLIFSADKVRTLKEEGVIAVESLVNETKKNKKASESVYDIIQETSNRVGKIEEASQMIKSIADQTNLLALNAAIEAARAGDAGKGFAVVAEEIRKLAEQSNSFTGEISTTIKNLIEKSNEAVNTMSNMKEGMEQQSKSVSLTNDKFNGISHSMENMESIIDIIKNSSVEMESKKNEIVQIIENLSAISEENAAGTQESLSSIEEQNNSIIEMAKASEQLAMLAEQMQKVVSQFKI